MSSAVSIRELVQPPKRRCGMAIHLRHKVDRNKHMVVGVLCKSWGCGTCRPHLQRKWIEHLHHMFQSSSEVFVSLVSKSRWRTVSTRIRRAGEQFATVEQANGLLTVFTTLLDEGERVSADTALVMLDKAIRNAITDHRPVHTSRGWGFPSDATPVKQSEWERVRKLTITVDEAEAVVVNMGLSVDLFWGEFRRGFIVDLPDGLDLLFDGTQPLLASSYTPVGVLV